MKIFDPHIQLDAVYGSNRAFSLRALPHIGRCMEKNLEAVLDWAEVMVITQRMTPNLRQVLESHTVPVIDLTSSQTLAVAKVEAV